MIYEYMEIYFCFSLEYYSMICICIIYFYYYCGHMADVTIYINLCFITAQLNNFRVEYMIIILLFVYTLDRSRNSTLYAQNKCVYV